MKYLEIGESDVVDGKRVTCLLSRGGCFSNNGKPCAFLKIQPRGSGSPKYSCEKPGEEGSCPCWMDQRPDGNSVVFIEE